MNFSYKLRSLIEERNLTQKQVANDLNIAPSTMGGYVQGISEPDFATLKRLATYFEVTTDYLLNMHTNKTNNFFGGRVIACVSFNDKRTTEFIYRTRQGFC